MARNTKAMKRGWNWDEANQQLNAMVDGTSPMKLGISTVAADGRAIRYVLTQATPAMSDGYGAVETDFTVTGTGTGQVAVDSTWLNLSSGSTLAGYSQLHTDGIWDGGATLTSANIAWGTYQCMLATNPAWCSLYRLNFDGANSEIDSMYDTNDPTLALGWTSGNPSGSTTGSIPFFSTAQQSIQYIFTYGSP